MTIKINNRIFIVFVTSIKKLLVLFRFFIDDLVLEEFVINVHLFYVLYHLHYSIFHNDDHRSMVMSLGNKNLIKKN
jgi:hypothetical protein